MVVLLFPVAGGITQRPNAVGGVFEVADLCLASPVLGPDCLARIVLDDFVDYIQVAPIRSRPNRVRPAHRGEIGGLEDVAAFYLGYRWLTRAESVCECLQI